MNITLEISANELRKKLNIKDGHTPVKGVDYFDGKNGYTPRKGIDYHDGVTPKIDLPKMQKEVTKEILKAVRKELPKEDTMNQKGWMIGGAGDSTTTSGVSILTIVSGTVDGSNTTFVLSGTPKTITVDGGRTMQRVSTDGTINWTGTGASIVLAIAPTFDLIPLG